jgi:hypothetical protein
MQLNVSLLAAAIIALAAPAVAAPSDAPKSKGSAVSSTMVFYLAKGDADACGEGCSEWIAAEGEIDGAASQRLRSFLNRIGKRKLPIFFHSPGGVGTTATEMGRQLRALEMTAGVSKTMPNGCVGASEQACRTLKQSGQVLPSTLQPISGCSSACVFALIGAKVRQVPAGARLGVHQAKLTLYRRDGGKLNYSDKRVVEYQRTRLAALNGQLRRYVQEMKVDVRLFDLGMTIPHESIHYLSRDEIAKFGVDTREFQETRWDTMELRPPDLWAMKFFVAGRDGDRKELHTSFLQVSCGSLQRARVVYFRHVRPDEAAAPKVIKLMADGRSVTFSSSATPVKLESIETGGSYNLWGTSASFEFLEAAAALDKIELTELGEANAVLRATKLSTGGMASAISALRKRCSATTATVPSMAAQ